MIIADIVTKPAPETPIASSLEFMNDGDMSKTGRTVLELPPRRGNPRNSEGAFIRLADGRLLFAWSKFTGGANDDSAAVIACRTSRDQGRTWSNRDRILIDQEGAQNVMSVSLLRLHDGRIALFYAIKNGFHDCRLRMRTSGDEGRTWSRPVLVTRAPGYFVVNNDRVVQLSSGRLIVPAAFHRRRTDAKTDWRTFDARGIALFYLSDDGGKSWRESLDWLSLHNRTRSGLQEPGVIELLDGRLFGWARTDQGCQYGMFSDDAGDTWTPPFPTEFRSPCSPLSMKRIPENDALLAVWNDHSGRYPIPAEKSYNSNWGRTPLVAAVSHDEGRTWQQHLRLEADRTRGFCYTAIHFTDDRHILLAYCAGGKHSANPLDTLRIRRLPVTSLIT